MKSVAAKAVELPKPFPTISTLDAVAIVVGIVIGAGIFRAPSFVAANVGSAEVALLLWVAGGAVSLVGALCYAELATTFPHSGGDYHYLMRAYGRPPAFLFAWSRMTVIQTGSLALLSFVFGDYASQVFRLGEYSSSIYAGLLVVLLTTINVFGVQQGTRTQNLLTTLEVLCLLIVIVVGLALITSPATPEASAVPAQASQTTAAGIGYAMVFVLLTYGGWNEAAYVSAEMVGARRNIARALLWSIGLITGLYLLVNWAYLHVLGLTGVAESEAVAADLMQQAIGVRGSQIVSVLIAIAALTSANATVFTGARTNYALGRDFLLLRFLGRWHGRNTPRNALVVQGVIALALVIVGTMARNGFATMVDYTAPVFWSFFLLTGVSLIILRIKEPGVTRPFRVPFYPLTPLLFCAVCVYMLQSSLAYTGVGALVGVAVLLVGVPVFLLASKHQDDLLTDKDGG